MDTLDVEMLPFMQEQVAPGRVGVSDSVPSMMQGRRRQRVRPPAGTRRSAPQPSADCCEHDVTQGRAGAPKWTAGTPLTEQEGQVATCHLVSVCGRHLNSLTEASFLAWERLRGAGDLFALPDSDRCEVCFYRRSLVSMSRGTGSRPFATFTAHSSVRLSGDAGSWGNFGNLNFFTINCLLVKSAHPSDRQFQC